MLRSGSLEVVVNRTKDTTAAETPTTREALLGARPSFSPTPAATTWMMEMKEVRPAMVKEAKKRTELLAKGGNSYIGLYNEIPLHCSRGGAGDAGAPGVEVMVHLLGDEGQM